MEGAMKKVLITSGTLVALIAGAPAMAADSGVGAPPAYAPVNDWSGFYVGGHAGYGWGHDPFTSSLVSRVGSLASYPTMSPR
jgi:opacity protein-like surface antigen